jgi:hypothetical protein
VTIHALLHIADGIKANGPVWCYWAFPMERHCGALQPAIRSRRFPYASLDRYAVEDAQLTQIKVVYNVAEELSLRPPRKVVAGSYSTPLCMSWQATVSNILMAPLDPSCLLLPPKVDNRPAPNLISGIVAALATRFELRVTLLRPHLDLAQIKQWGKIRRIDSEAGDTMCASSLGIKREDSRDATFVRVRSFQSNIISPY